MSNKLDPKRKIFFAVFVALAVILSISVDMFLARLRPPRALIEPQGVAHVRSVETESRAAASTASQGQSVNQNAERTVSVNQNAERVVAEHATYLARYLNSDFSRKPGTKMVAVATVSENGVYNFAVNAALSSHLKTDSTTMLTSFFLAAFVSDGLFANTFAGSNGVFDKLGLSKSLDVLLLGREQVQYSTNPSLENLMTANMQLEITAFSIADGQSQSWTFVANGAGFKQSEARLMAEDRLIKQIGKDTKMSIDF